MITPSILINAKKEFETLKSKSLRNYRVFNWIGKGIILIVMGAGVINSLYDEIGMAPRDTRIMSSLIAFLMSLYQSYSMEKGTLRWQILHKKCVSNLRRIDLKISEFEDFFRGSDEETNIEVPEEYSINTLTRYISSLYQEMDDLELTALVSGSYERVLAGSS